MGGKREAGDERVMIDTDFARDAERRMTKAELKSDTQQIEKQ